MGGKSSSSSSTASTTKNLDMRVVGAEGSSNASTYIEASGSTVTLTDSGAVNGAFMFATGVERDAFGFAAEVAQDAFDMSSASQINANQTILDAVEGVKDAYSDAKQGEQNILAAVGLAVVAMVAVQVVKGNK